MLNIEFSRMYNLISLLLWILPSWGCGNCMSFKTWTYISLILTTKLMHANNLIFCRKMMDKTAEMQISVGVLDPNLLTSTNIS
jgi:hypothetical protein